MSTTTALQQLGLPPELAPYEGQVQTRTTYGLRVYEIYDYTGKSMVIRYEVEKMNGSTQAFGMYPFNYASNLLYNFGHTITAADDTQVVFDKPSSWVLHEPPSGLAGQRVYYCKTSVKYRNVDAQTAAIDFMTEPYETVVNGKAEDMKDPLIRAQYLARIVKLGADGKPYTVWTSKYAITPKRRLRRAEFMKLSGMTEQDLMFHSRTQWNIVKVSNTTHITSIAMDIEQPQAGQLKSVVYINGQDARTFNYQALVNSFGQKYTGYLWLWRLYNGPRIGGTTDNVYGSTLNAPINNDGTLKVVAGSTNSYDAATHTLTFNPSLTEEAKIIAYMEFMPANGKNENVGKEYSLETGIEKYF
jgi:hypothetical protein